MFLSKIFGRRKEKYDAQDYDQSEYAKLQTESIVEELNLSDEAQAKRYVIDLCEQMIAASRELEDARSEYDLVTYYLTDIQIIEELTEAERAPILDCAMHVAKLDRERNEFLKTKRKLTETQFAQMQEEEDLDPIAREAMCRILKEKLETAEKILVGIGSEWELSGASGTMSAIWMRSKRILHTWRDRSFSGRF